MTLSNILRQNTPIFFKKYAHALPQVVWVMGLTLLFRLALTIPAWVGANFLSPAGGVPPGLPFAFTEFPGVWARWDSGHYLTIVRQGYARDMERAFMPLFPMLAALFSFGQFQWAVWGGWLVSNVAFVAAVGLLWQQLKQDYDKRIANLSLIALNVFPTAFFFSALYTESLFLLFFAGVYVLSRRSKFFLAACIICLAGITRINGLVLFVIIAIEMAQQLGWRTPAFWFRLIGYGALALLGLLGLVAYYQTTLNLPFAFLEQQRTLMQRTPTFAPLAIFDQFRMVLFGYGGFERNWFMRVIGLFDLTCLLLFIGLAWLSYNRVRNSLFVYAVASLLVITSSHGPGSMGVYAASRYMLPIFTGFVTMALLLRDRTWLQRTLFAASATFMLGLLVWWASGRWVA